MRGVRLEPNHRTAKSSIFSYISSMHILFRTLAPGEDSPCSNVDDKRRGRQHVFFRFGGTKLLFISFSLHTFGHIHSFSILAELIYFPGEEYCNYIVL